MRIRLADLREAIRNPSAFMRAGGKVTKGFGRSRYMTLRDVALDYHNHLDLGVSVALLESKLTNNFKTTKGNDGYLHKLQEYTEQFAALGTTVAKVRNNVKVPLPDNYIDFHVTGQVTRLDLDPATGYCAWIFANKTDDWKEDLRFPLLQYACAMQLNVEAEEITPGVYDFSTGTYTRLPNSEKQVRHARRKLTRFLEKLKSLG